MLVLKRRVDERIVISGGIVITVTEINGHEVSLGFTAPPHIRIDREEIANKRVAKDEPADRFQEEQE